MELRDFERSDSAVLWPKEDTNEPKTSSAVFFDGMEDEAGDEARLPRNGCCCDDEVNPAEDEEKEDDDTGVGTSPPLLRPICRCTGFLTGGGGVALCPLAPGPGPAPPARVGWVVLESQERPSRSSMGEMAVDGTDVGGERGREKEKERQDGDACIIQMPHGCTASCEVHVMSFFSPHSLFSSSSSHRPPLLPFLLPYLTRPYSLPPL